MKNAEDETLTFASSLYSSFLCCFEAFEIEQQPHDKLCSHVRLLHMNFHPLMYINFERMNLILKKKQHKHNPSFPFLH